MDDRRNPSRLADFAVARIVGESCSGTVGLCSLPLPGPGIPEVTHVDDDYLMLRDSEVAAGVDRLTVPRGIEARFGRTLKDPA